jgi:hypothetical protein
VKASFAQHDQYRYKLIKEGSFNMSVNQKAYDEIVDFFARGTSSTGVIGYRPSSEAQERVHELLAKNKAGNLTTEEEAELELFGELEHFMQLVKARAHQYVESQS